MNDGLVTHDGWRWMGGLNAHAMTHDGVLMRHDDS